jgi:DNA-binding Lrp family transcriptional regulator
MLNVKNLLNSGGDRVAPYIIAALQMNGKESINKISRQTGFHFDTIKAHIQRLVAEGTVEKIPKDEFEYRLAAPKKEEENLS